MNFLGVGLPEMILIFVVALLVFGPRKLPEISRTIAKSLKTLQDASKEFETTLNREANELEKATRKGTGSTSRSSRLNPKANQAAKTDPAPTDSDQAEIGQAEIEPAGLNPPDPESTAETTTVAEMESAPSESADQEATDELESSLPSPEEITPKETVSTSEQEGSDTSSQVDAA